MSHISLNEFNIGSPIVIEFSLSLLMGWFDSPILCSTKDPYWMVLHILWIMVILVIIQFLQITSDQYNYSNNKARLWGHDLSVASQTISI